LLKRIGDSAVDSEWRDSYSSALAQIGNHVDCLELELEFDNTGESTFVKSLKEEMTEKIFPSTPAPVADLLPPAAQN